MVKTEERFSICKINKWKRELKIRRINLTGKKYGFLTVQEMLYKYNGQRHTYCRCLCECGNEKIISVDNLKKNPMISCGCMSNYYRAINNRTNEVGHKYGALTILDIDYSTKPSKAKCMCECGNEVYVSKADVVSGHTQSCGCLQRQRAMETNTKDFSGTVSDCGVIITTKSHKHEHGVWYWNCICPLCGKEFQALPAKIIANHTTSCGCKIQSSKERIIENHLKALNVVYKREQRFPDCTYKYTLPFDFAVYNSKGDLDFLIEYDGEQHYRPVALFGGVDEYHTIKIRDDIKNEYCILHNIKLLRFNYKDTTEYILNSITNTIYP